MFPVISFPTHFIKEEAEEIYGPLRRCSVILRNPFPLPPEPVSPLGRIHARMSLGLPPQGFVMGNAGWLIERKRWDVFFEVAARVRASIPGAVFVVAGDGPERARLTALVASLGLADGVIWLGWRTDMDKVYAALDVLLFTSEWDALGRTPIEAAAWGVPVVASVKQGGLSEILRDGKEAFVSSDHDVDRLAEQVTRLATSGLAAPMIGAARERIRQACSPELDTLRLLKYLGLSSGTDDVDAKSGFPQEQV